MVLVISQQDYFNPPSPTLDNHRLICKTSSLQYASKDNHSYFRYAGTRSPEKWEVPLPHLYQSHNKAPLGMCRWPPLGSTTPQY